MIDRTRQFGILEVMGAVTVAATFFAIAAPAIRGLRGTQQMWLFFGYSAAMLCLFVAALVIQLHERANLLKSSGEMLYTAIPGDPNSWKDSPTGKAIVYLLLILVAQVWLAVFFSRFGHAAYLTEMAVLVIPILGSRVMLSLLWRRPLGSFEFFENGVGLFGIYLAPWNQVEIRRSQYFDEQMILVRNQKTHKLYIDRESFDLLENARTAKTKSPTQK